jgi:hypothetical protein
MCTDLPMLLADAGKEPSWAMLDRHPWLPPTHRFPEDVGLPTAGPGWVRVGMCRELRGGVAGCLPEGSRSMLPPRPQSTQAPPARTSKQSLHRPGAVASSYRRGF